MHQQVGERFLLRDWADGCVVFDRRYGNTHSLNSTTAKVFKALLAAPGETQQQVISRLRFESHGADTQWGEEISQALEQLAAHQLTARD